MEESPGVIPVVFYDAEGAVGIGQNYGPIDDKDGGYEKVDVVPYERLRANNIKEKEEMFRRLFPDVEQGGVFKDSSKVLKDPDESVNSNIIHRVKRRKKTPAVPEVGEEIFRRSERKRKNIDYNYNWDEADDDEDVEVTSRGKKEKIKSVKPDKRKINYDGNKVDKDDKEFTSRGQKEKGLIPSKSEIDTEEKIDTEETFVNSNRVLRPKKIQVYKETSDFYEPQNDDFVWCEICRSAEFHGCEKHPPNFSEPARYNLEISPSSVGSNSGVGVFNRGETIPVGTLFGPYTGKFISQKLYNEVITAKNESGNAWEIRNNSMTKVIGVCDPGNGGVGGSSHWMSKINCPVQDYGLNLVSFQLHGHIYYKVIKSIVINAELQVFYGSKYAEEMGIDMSTFRKFKGKENHTTEGVGCSYCTIGVVNQDVLNKHLGKGVGNQYNCRIKQDQVMVSKAGQPGREYVCPSCGKGFATRGILDRHAAVHTGLKCFACPRCEKSYSQNSTLNRHIKAAHEHLSFACPKCNKRFSSKSIMKLHFKMIHDKLKDLKCLICGMTFSDSGNLKQHTKAVHNKQRDYRCHHCDHAFGLKRNMLTHINSVHLKLKEACNWPGCNYSGLPGVRMDYHRRQVHTKEYTFECRPCEDLDGIWWGTVIKTKMTIHMKAKHPVEWAKLETKIEEDNPEVCKITACGKRFATEVELERHNRKLH